MADTMRFPQTIEEFMEQYKIIDTEQVYSNGVEFVPIFRIKQWLEHLPTTDIVRCENGRGERMTVDDIFDALYLQAKEINGLTKLRDYVLEDKSINCLSFRREDEPAIEFVKVVRCKDCKRYTPFRNIIGGEMGEGECEGYDPCVPANHFCSRGERKEREE